MAKSAAVPVGPAVDNYGGPTGTQGLVYLARRQLRMLVDGQAVAPSRPLIYDTCEYEGKGRAATPDATTK